MLVGTNRAVRGALRGGLDLLVEAPLAGSRRLLRAPIAGLGCPHAAPIEMVGEDGERDVIVVVCV